MANKKIPPKAVTEQKSSKNVPDSKHINYRQQYPCWRIYRFDIKSKWGISALGNFTIKPTAELEEKLSENKDVYNAISKLDKKQFSSIPEMWKNIHKNCKSDIPLEIMELINDSISNSFFIEKIYPKLIQFEKMKWEDIEKAVHGDKGKSNSHSIEIDKLTKEARDRLDSLGLNDIDKIFSLRLDGKIRIFGIRVLNYMEIIWIDPKHEICPSLH